MRKTLALAATLVALLITVGCSSTPAPSTPAAPAPEAPSDQAPAAQPAPQPAPTAPATPAAKKFQLTLAGASPGGLWSLLGEGVSNAIDKAYPGSAVTYQTSGGGLANVGLVSSGQVPMGIVHNVEARAAVNGDEPFKAPITNLRAVAYMYNWSPHQFVARKDWVERHGIKSLADLKEKKPPLRVGVNQRGNMVEAMNENLFAGYGITYADIESWGGQVVFVASGEMTNLMRDRRLDMIANSVFAPHSSILEVANALPVVMLPLEQDVIEKNVREMGSDPYVIKKGTYEWVTEDIPTVAMGAMLVVRDDANEDDIYLITKALVENINLIQGVHKSMAALTPELMAGQAALPYHPGAERYYKEQGLMK